MESPAIARELRSLTTRYSASTRGMTSLSRASRNQLDADDAIGASLVREQTGLPTGSGQVPTRHYKSGNWRGPDGVGINSLAATNHENKKVDSFSLDRAHVSKEVL